MRMKRGVILLIGIAVMIVIAIAALVRFGRRPAPAPEAPVVGQPQPSPRTILGITLPRAPFFMSPPAPRPTAGGALPATPPPSPSPAASPRYSPPAFPARTPAPAPTSQQVFDFLWPKEYRDYLAYVQDNLIEQGAIPRGERSSFSSEDDVIAFLVRSVDYLAEQGIIAASDVPNFKKGIQQDLRNKKVQEYHYYLQIAPQYPSPPPFPMPSPSAEQPMTLGRALVAMFTGAYRQLYAQVECFAVRKPNWPIPGFSLWAPTCSSFSGKVPIGCLNAVCVAGNALWDPLTGICGCD